MEAKFEIVDAGTYMFDGDSSGRWCIRHPENSYFPNESGMFDCYIEDAENPNRKPVKFLGSFLKLKEAKKDLIAKWKRGESYETLN